MVNQCYQKNRENLQKKACERYQNLSEEEKEKKVEYMRNYYLTRTKIILEFYKVVGN